VYTANQNLFEQLRALPKLELHCHLLGTIQEQTFREWIYREQAPITEEEILAFFRKSEKPLGAIRVLRALDQWLIRSPADLFRLTYEYLAAAAAHQVVYSEFYWNPTGTAQLSKIAYQEALAAILDAMQSAQRDLNIRSALIPAIDREAHPRAALEMVEWVIANPHPSVVGIGIDYRETDHPPEWFSDAYQLARRHGLKTTAHAGEFGCPAHNVRTCVEQLQVDRLDHAYTAIDDPLLCEQIAQRDLLVTVVPTNSYYKRTLAPERWAQDHPIRKMPGQGLRIHPNTDDPTLHHVTPTEAWLMMVRDFGFGHSDLLNFMHNGLHGAWLDSDLKRSWREQHTQMFHQIFKGDKGHGQKPNSTP
jgi:adenine deaminase